MKKRTINTQGKTKKLVEETAKNAQYRIGFDQSVSSGVIGVKGEVTFTDSDGIDALYELRDYLRNFESMLSNAGYMVATEHAPKKNGNSKKEE